MHGHAIVKIYKDIPMTHTVSDHKCENDATL